MSALEEVTLKLSTNTSDVDASDHDATYHGNSKITLADNEDGTVMFTMHNPYRKFSIETAALRRVLALLDKDNN